MSHMRSNKPIYQFVVTLKHTEPAIYRRIEVPKTYTFWDLHVAIQDAFGWQDCNLHEFCYEDRNGNPKGNLRIGIPIDDGFVNPKHMPEAGWQMKIEDLFYDLGDNMLYLYDFGDHWEHSVVLEGIILGEKRIKYPRCTEGAHLAPPEDCGGIHGFYHMLDVLKNPKDLEYKEMIQWVKTITDKKNYLQDSFDSHSVRFTNPQKRLRQMLEEEV